MQNPPLDILFEDNYIIAINKPAGIMVQSDKAGNKGLDDMVREYQRIKYNKKGEAFIGVPHRIDRPVSGVVIMAKRSKPLQRLNEMFREKQMRKTYWAVVGNKPEQLEGHLVNWLKKNEQKNISTAYDHEVKGSSKCELDYKWLKSIEHYHLLEVNPHTGRHHQIRVQLAKMGCPIKGDVKYGARRGNRDGSIHLHARKLEFTHPNTHEKIEIIAPVPDDVVWKAFGNSTT
ncbi:MAG TPA: RluA family pseudouridine synthase [Chitinophagales bacterium]|nr:RluA family pseudouridine synthase [Chitinophagales bacterium]